MARTGLHILLGVLLWIVFGYYWYIVARRPITPHTQIALIVVSAIVLVLTAFHVVWIYHNRRIARKHKRRRKQRRLDAPSPATDFLGRKFDMPPLEKLHGAPYIEIHVIQLTDDKESTGHKIYRTDEVPG